MIQIDRHEIIYHTHNDITGVCMGVCAWVWVWVWVWVRVSEFNSPSPSLSPPLSPSPSPSLPPPAGEVLVRLSMEDLKPELGIQSYGLRSLLSNVKPIYLIFYFWNSSPLWDSCV